MDLSPSTIYRWVAAGYDGMTNMELRRKVGYRPRKRAAGRAATRHSARRSHAAFLALGEDACAAAWEMDTVEGDARGGRGGVAGRLRRGGRGARRSRPDAGAHREGARREGRCPAGLA